MSDIPKAYNPSEVEDKWYTYWEENHVFDSDVDESKEPYTIVIPPPNVTGMLHMGHILNNTLQDIFIRLKKMQGYNACWVPGTDHASIATEAKVVAMLKEQGIDKHSLSREEFLEHCWKWTEKYGGIIISQLRKLGVSCDWRRERFTMDDHYYSKVIETFVELYKAGKIYRGYRMVNWDPASKSAISDEEVNYRTIQGKLWYFKYPVKGTDSFIHIATTRPETMLGDTAVAVNPEDERYKDFIGKTIVLPLVGREIPVISDEYVDKEFGTGAVKITPAHDVNDYEMGKRHDLEFINILHPDASMNSNVPEEFQGLDRYDCRKKVVARMEEEGFLEKIEDYQTNVGYSERGKVPIEPYMSEQWFMKMDELSKPALEVVREGKVNFHPDHWKKTYDHWLTNITDWCISRQLWWGHQIPVWYHKETNEIYCDTEPPKDIENWRQDTDVLDTWASSWLWAYDTFKTDEEQNYYYPTNLLVTAPDIIFFWVARMIMAGLYFKKDIPFHDVYFTSVIRDVQGRKMSKSLGNSPDPLDVIAEFGADALRFTIIYLAPLGQDVLFSADRCEIGRNFANKIWNAARFLLMNKEECEYNPEMADKNRDFVDDWMDSRLHRTLKELENAMNKFEINIASKTIYSFVWNDFCDWYIELIKNKFYSDDAAVKSSAITRALDIFEQMLKLIHPFMPYISEELWHLLHERKEGETITYSKYPVADEAKIDAEGEKKMALLQNVITGIRNIRGEMNIPPQTPISVKLKTDAIDKGYVNYIAKLTRCESVDVDANLDKPAKSASAIVNDCEIYIPLEGLIDLDVERQRLEKEIKRIEGSLNGIRKKLQNPNFVDKAPEDVVNREKKKLEDFESNLSKFQEILKSLS